MCVEGTPSEGWGKGRALTFRWERGSKGKSRPNAGCGSLNVEILMDLLPKGRQKLEFICYSYFSQYTVALLHRCSSFIPISRQSSSNINIGSLVSCSKVSAIASALSWDKTFLQALQEKGRVDCVADILCFYRGNVIEIKQIFSAVPPGIRSFCIAYSIN